VLPCHAALCGARRQHIDIDQALNDVCAAVPEANPNLDFRAALRQLHPATNTATRGGQR